MSASTSVSGVAARPRPPRLLPFQSSATQNLVVTPDGETHRPRPRVVGALVKAIAPAHHWQRLLESGECASITELAAAEKIDRSCLCRVLRLTLLAPEIVEAMMDGQQAEEVTLPTPAILCPADWGWAKRFRQSREV